MAAGRLFALEPEEELAQLGARSLDLDENALRGILNPADEAQILREAVDERAKADALHDATYNCLGAFVMGSHGGKNSAWY